MFQSTKFIVSVYFLIHLCTSVVVVLADEKDTWAILVSTMDSYKGYGLEAATYKTYQLLRQRGVPAEQIIVFSHDVAAFHSANPFPSVIYYGVENITGDTENVYDGIRLDYVAENNTAENFIAVLTGDKEAVNSGSRRVLESGPESTLLIYYTGWGYYGSVIFPEGNDETYLYAEQFVPIVEDLYNKGKYEKALLVFDSQLSATLFDNYLEQNDQAVIAVTSQGLRDGSFYVCALNKVLGVYTAPCFSYYWINFLEANPQAKLIDAYNWIRSAMSDASPIYYVPRVYGNLNLSRKSIAEFFGSEKQQSKKIALNSTSRRSLMTKGAILGKMENSESREE